MTIAVDGRPAEPAGCPQCGAPNGRRLWRRHGFEWLRCAADGMVWVSPRLTPEAVAAIYAAGHATKAAGLGAADRAVPARYRDIVARLAAIAGTASIPEVGGIGTTDIGDGDTTAVAGRPAILEVGAFDGLFLQAASEADWRPYGTEIDAAAAADARSRGAAMHVGPLDSAPFDDAMFDAVALRDVIEHLPDPRAELARIARLMRGGGALYVWTPNFDSLTRRLYGQHWGAVVFPWHFSYFTAATLVRMIEDAGFDVVSLASRNLLLRRADPYRALAPGALSPATSSRILRPAGRRIERALVRLVNPAFARLDVAGRYWGAQLEMYARRRPAA